MKAYTEEDLQSAFNAGVRSVQINKERDDLIEQGTKKCPEEATFRTYLFMLNANEINLSNKKGGWIEPSQNVG